MVKYKLNPYKWGNILFAISWLAIFSISIYYITSTLILSINGEIFYYNFSTFPAIVLQLFYWVFLLIGIFNISLLIYCLYKEKDLSLSGNVSIVPFLILVIGLSTSLILSDVYYEESFMSIYPFLNYIIFIMIFDIILFIGVYIIIKEKLSELQ